jgi:hypothetical protein
LKGLKFFSPTLSDIHDISDVEPETPVHWTDGHTRALVISSTSYMSADLAKPGFVCIARPCRPQARPAELGNKGSKRQRHTYLQRGKGKK